MKSLEDEDEYEGDIIERSGEGEKKARKNEWEKSRR